MAEKIVSLAEHRPAVNADTVARLERALAMAKAGQIDAVALAYSSLDGYGGHGWSRAENSVLPLGAVGMLQARLAAHLATSSEDAPAP